MLILGLLWFVSINSFSDVKTDNSRIITDEVSHSKCEASIAEKDMLTFKLDKIQKEINKNLDLRIEISLYITEINRGGSLQRDHVPSRLLEVCAAIWDYAAKGNYNYLPSENESVSKVNNNIFKIINRCKTLVKSDGGVKLYPSGFLIPNLNKLNLTLVSIYNASLVYRDQLLKKISDLQDKIISACN